jgi:hypothetical protein
MLGAKVGYSLVASIQVDEHSMEVMGTLVDSGLSHL